MASAAMCCGIDRVLRLPVSQTARRGRPRTTAARQSCCNSRHSCATERQSSWRSGIRSGGRVRHRRRNCGAPGACRNNYVDATRVAAARASSRPISDLQPRAAASPIRNPNAPPKERTRTSEEVPGSLVASGGQSDCRRPHWPALWQPSPQPLDPVGLDQPSARSFRTVTSPPGPTSISQRSLRMLL